MGKEDWALPLTPYSIILTESGVFAHYASCAETNPRSRKILGPSA